eukprot:1455217-Pyramimonas_sp.AAC.1
MSRCFSQDTRLAKRLALVDKGYLAVMASGLPIGNGLVIQIIIHRLTNPSPDPSRADLRDGWRGGLKPPPPGVVELRGASSLSSCCDGRRIDCERWLSEPVM